MMVKILAVIALLSVAQIIPSCGGRPSSDESSVSESRPVVIGWVQEKRARVYEDIPHIIVIDQHEYGVPYEFWLSVEPGDLVKFDGLKWSIVRKARR